MPRHGILRAEHLRNLIREFSADASVCWDWDGSANRAGYGSVTVDGRRHMVHRIVYQWLVGPIPHGHDIDHLCRNPRCFNPHHMEAVTHRVNVLRGQTFAASQVGRTHCLRGHPLAGDNLYIQPGTTKRSCLTCRRAAARQRKSKGGVRPEMRTHCVHGHPLSGDNLVMVRNGKYMKRACRTCNAARERKYRERRHQLRGAS